MIGVIARNGATLRAPIVDGLFGAIFGYVMACATVLVIALVINLLAPLFGGRRGFDSAFKLAVYSFTPVWLAGIFLTAPGLRFLALFGFYGVYILWLGVPRLMQSAGRNVAQFTRSRLPLAPACSFTRPPRRNTRCSARAGL